MNSYQNSIYPTMDNTQPTTFPQVPPYQTGTPYPQVPGYPSGVPYPQVPSYPQPVPTPPTTMPVQTSYIENILRLNLGKVATVYMNFENSQWGSKIFKGVLRAAGLDHIIIVDQDTGIHYLLLTIYLDYITFSEPINYAYPFTGAQGPVSTPSPVTSQPSTPFTSSRKKEHHED